MDPLGTNSLFADEFSSRVLYLTKVSYNEAKHEVLVEFANEHTKLVQRERFFPYLSFSPSLESQKLSSLVLSLGFKGFSIEEENNLLILKALSFSDLKKISNSLSLHINKKPLVLEPERAFLLSKNWSYFDAFEQVGNTLYKLDYSFFGANPQKNWRGHDLGFFLTKEISFMDAMHVSEADALFLVERAAWSSLLKVPLAGVPSEVPQRVELFLENVFSKNGEMLLFESVQKVFSQADYEPFSRDSTSNIDFSLVWADLFSNNFFNLGADTKNCSCCTPLTLESNNLLPSSTIKVRFSEDNLYFESSSDSFAFEYHNSFPFKEERLSKKKEFCMNSFPIGPFFKEDSALVPLFDAKRLISEGKAVLVSSKEEQNMESSQTKLHSLNWFCKNKESFFSKEVRSTNSDLVNLRKQIDLSEGKLVQSEFSYFYYKSLYSAMKTILAQLPLQLTNSSSKFYSTELAKSIISVQEATLAKFKEFSESNGYRVLHAGKNNAFVKGFSSLKLAKDFSIQTKLPQPQIAGFNVKAKQRFGRVVVN